MSSTLHNACCCLCFNVDWNANSQESQLDLTGYGVLGHPEMLLLFLSGDHWAANLPPDQLDTSF